MLCKTVSQNNINIQKLLFMSPKDFWTTSTVTRTVNEAASQLCTMEDRSRDIILCLLCVPLGLTGTLLNR